MDPSPSAQKDGGMSFLEVGLGFTVLLCSFLCSVL